MKLGMIFPGQGSQFVGMAKTFYDEERLVQEYFEQASSCLDQNFVKLCFASSEKELMETVNTQTSIFLVSAAIYSLLNKKYNITPDIVAGHSLGEYSAVFAAGGINFPDGLYLLKKRALFMEEETRLQDGGMLAVLNFPEEQLQPILQRYDQPGSDKAVAEIVNYNSPRQLVVSGTMPELLAIKEEVGRHRGKALMLKVSGAFHSRLMKEAEKRFTAYLAKVDFHDLTMPLINNADAELISHADMVRQSLVKGISSPVRWWPSMRYFSDCDVIVEIAPGEKLTKMLKREFPEKQFVSINEQKDIDVLAALLEQYQTPPPPAEQPEAEIQE